MSGFLQYLIVGVMEGGIYAIIGVTIVLVFKATQVASLAHGHLLAFGAFFFYFFYSSLGLPLIIALILTFAASCLLGLLIERVALRPLIGQPIFTAFLITFALFLAMDSILNVIIGDNIILDFPDFLPPWTMEIFQVNFPLSQLVGFTAALVVFGLIGLFFRYTRIGLNMLATAENHQLAQSTGINVKGIFSFVWVFSSMVAAVAGMATANITDISYTLPYLGIKGLIVALFGGLDSVLGALIGGLVLGLLENLAAGYIDPLVGGGIKEVAAYFMLLLILLIRPYGLFGQVRIERI